MDSKACVDHDEVSIEEVFQCGLHDVSGSPWMSTEEEYQCGLQGVSGSPRGYCNVMSSASLSNGVNFKQL